MGRHEPTKLNAATVRRCARIAGVRQRAHFEQVLIKLVAGACRWHERHRQVAADRTRIVEKGRVFAKALREAVPEARRSLDRALPYGAHAWLSAMLDAMAPPKRGPRGRHNSRAAQFVMLLCANVEKAGGGLTLNEKTGQGSLLELLEVLKPHLPTGFLAYSHNTLARLKTSAAHLSRHVPQ